MKKRSVIAVLGIVLFAVLIVLFYPRTPSHAELRLYAGAGLQRAVDKLVAAFDAKTGITVAPDYGGSGLVLSRAIDDKTADLFLPGDVWYVDKLEKKAHTVAERATVAYFVPTIIVAKGNPKHIKGLADLARSDVRVGLGKIDACQIGRTSAKILRGVGIDPVKMANLQQSLTVNQLGVWVKMKTVDAAIVWGAIAANVANDVDIIPIPPKENKISTVVLARLSTSRHPNAAHKFLAFVSGPEGQKILRETGYRVVLGKAAGTAAPKK